MEDNEAMDILATAHEGQHGYTDLSLPADFVTEAAKRQSTPQHQRKERR